MSELRPQTYENHARFDPLFHFVLAPIAVITIGLAIWNLVQSFSLSAAWIVVLAVAAFVAMLKFRRYALKAQDRIIRLEERLRLAVVLSEPWLSRIGELNESQLVALRFASDAELPGLVEKVLTAKLGSAEIKKAIVNWRPDYFRV